MFLLLLSLLSFSAGKHSHGAMEIGISFDGSNGKIEWHGSADGIIGFEYQAKNEKQKLQSIEQLGKLEAEMAQMIQFQAELGCQISKEQIQQKFEGKKHSDIQASFFVKCAKSPSGSKITFFIQKVFPKLKKVEVDILVDSIQKSIHLKKDGTSVDLK